MFKLTSEQDFSSFILWYHSSTSGCDGIVPSNWSKQGTARWTTRDNVTPSGRISSPPVVTNHSPFAWMANMRDQPGRFTGLKSPRSAGSKRFLSFHDTGSSCVVGRRNGETDVWSVLRVVQTTAIVFFHSRITLLDGLVSSGDNWYPTVWCLVKGCLWTKIGPVECQRSFSRPRCHLVTWDL